MMNVPSNFASAISLSIFLTALSNDVIAQQADKAGSVRGTDTIEEIIVTAQKREQRLQDVGINVTAFTNSDLRELELFGAADISRQVPNFDMKPGVKGQNFVFTIRGIGLNDFNSNNNSAAGVYLNEVYQTSPAMLNFQLYDLERVEVLKGPQGTLYGRNATAGAINFLTRRPTNDFDAYVRAGVGDYEFYTVEGMVNIPLGDAVAARLSGLVRNQGEDFYTNLVDGQDLGKRESFSLRGQLEWRPNDAFDANLFVQREETEQPIGLDEIYGTSDGVFGALDGNFCGPALAGELSKDPSCVDVAGFIDPSPDVREGFLDPAVASIRPRIEATDVTLRVGYDFGAVALDSVTGYKNWERSNWVHDADSSPLVTADFYTDDQIEQISQELRLSGQSDLLVWTFGLFVSSDQVDKRDRLESIELLGAAFGVPLTNQLFRQETDVIAIFGHGEWRLTDKLVLTTGLRFSDEERSLTGAVDPFVPVIDNKINEDDLSGKVALDYSISDEVLVYGSISKGYKSGGFFADFATDLPDFDPFTKEELYAYEVGSKYFTANRNLELTTSVFFYDYNDKQANIQKGLAFGLSNIEQVDLYGLDLDILWRATDNLDFRVGLGLLSSEVQSEEMVGGFLGADTNLKGTRLADAPEVTGNAMARYTWDLPGGAALKVQADTAYTGEIEKQMGEDPLTRADAYWLANARIAWASAERKWEIAAWVKNLGDEVYTTTSSDTPILGHVEVEVGPPRTWGVTATYSFNDLF